MNPAYIAERVITYLLSRLSYDAIRRWKRK